MLAGQRLVQGCGLGRWGNMNLVQEFFLAAFELAHDGSPIAQAGVGARQQESHVCPDVSIPPIHQRPEVGHHILRMPAAQVADGPMQEC